jgi:flagellar motor protein MotB
MKKRFVFIGMCAVLFLSLPALMAYAGGNKEKKKLQEDLAACRSESETLKQENTTLKTTVDELTAKITGLDGEKADLEARIADLEARITDLEAEIETLTAEGEDISMVSKTVEQRIQMQDAEIIQLKQDKADLQKRNTDLEDELAQAKSEIDSLQADVGALKSVSGTNADLARQIQELQDEKAALEEEKAALEAQLEDMTKSKNELESALALYEGAEREGKVVLEDAYARIQEALSDEIDAGKVHLSRGTLGVVIDIVGEYMFDVGKVEINPTGKTVLAKLAPLITELDGYFVGVIGNADNKPVVTASLRKRFGTNWELSAHRGAVVVRYLIGEGGISPTRMIAMGFGEFQPIEDNSTPEGRGKNRRIDIVLLPVDVLASAILGAEIR